MITYPIPFNKATTTPVEFQYMMEAIERGHVSGDGHFTQKCNVFLEELLSVPKVLLTTSCTHALEMAALLLDIQPGDEVIVPSFTFVSTANAFVLRGATPIFADSREDTLNIDEKQLESLVSEKTKAIVPVHYGGIGCEMDVISELATRHNIAVVEDNAHGLFGKYRGKDLGTFGCLATQSFHETKNISCGEGGALIVNDAEFIERAEILREKGTNRSRFFRGLVDKYSWVDVGSSYLPSDLLAAFLFAQLERYEQIQNKRQQIWERYFEQLGDWAKANDVILPTVPPHCDQAWHMFYMIMPSLKQRQDLIAHLKAHGILSVFHYIPLHLSEMGQKFGGKLGQCPIAEDRSERLIRLPFFNSLTDQEQETVIQAIRQFDFKKYA
ncbi:dTDP-4-amino-4,6-dideoxygalactose transaminase [Abditibacteriota bacterium]|nr:dTDP-4-amino-4,6-dideoxygalactose transaminase [Abditibacteriota bacterium]